MKIYKQGKGECVWWSIAQAINLSMGVEIPEEEIKKYIKKNGRKNNKLISALQFLKSEPLFGFKVKHWAILFNEETHERPNMFSIRHAALDPDYALLLSLKIRFKKSPKIHLDNNFTVVSYPGLEKVSDHAVPVKGLHEKNKLLYRCVNSWGEDWGDKGEFNIHSDQFYSEIGAAYSAIFVKAN